MAAAGRNRSGRIFILIALVMILLLAIAGFLLRDQILKSVTGGGTTTQKLNTPTPPQDMIRIIILAQPVPRGAEIKDDMIKDVAYPRAELVQGLFYVDKQAVLGMRAKYDLPQGTPLTPALLSDKPIGSMAAIQVPRGMVAVSIPANRLELVSYALQPGDHVNIIASLLMLDLDSNFQSRLPDFTAAVTAPGPATKEAANSQTTAALTIASGGLSSTRGRTELDPVLNQPIYILPSEAQRPRLISQTIVQDAMVLWVGEFPADGKIDMSAPTPTPVAPAEGQQGPQPAAPAPRPDIITVVVSPQDAQTIDYLLLAGANLNLALRSAGDNQRIATEAVTLQFVLDQYGIPYPAKLPYGLEPAVSELPANLPFSNQGKGPALTTGQ